MTAWCHLPTIFKQRRILLTAGILTLCAALITTLFFASASYAQQSTNRTLNFQGRLQSVSGAVVPDGHYNMQFKIYQGGTGTAEGNPGGSDEWTETYINNGGTSGVEVKNGFFSVSLGSQNPFSTSVDWNQETLFLSMNVAGTATACTAFDTAPCAADGEMLPMKRITATPYAINSGAVGGKTVDQLIQNTTTLQSGSIALQSANDSNITAYIEGRNGQTASNVVIKQGASQTGKALDVQSSGGSSYFNIDSTGTLNQTGNASIGGNLGVGVASPSRPLDVAVSSSSTNSLPVRIAQNGTGDTGIELSTTSSGKYSMGIDATDGSFKIASSIAGGTTANLGYADIGSVSGSGNYRHAQAQKYTATDSGPVLNMSVYLSSVDSFCPNIQLGIYADNGSGTAPATLLGSSTLSAGAVGWNTKTLTTTVNMTSGTIYWLGLYTNCDNTTKLVSGVGTRAHIEDVSSLPGTFSAESTSAGQLSLYATIDTSNNVVDSFGGNASIFTLGETGNTTFKGSTDSNSAFQVQNSAGGDMLSVNTDTANGAQNVQIGDGTATGTPTLITLDKASSAPTVQSALLGSMYYDTTLGKVQCYEADGWGACGAAPDTFITISPEYTNAVMNGTDIGTITSDLCSDTLNINDGSSSQPTICGTNETYNFYKWTSAETGDQTRSIFVTYQLPSNFKSFIAGSTSLMGRTNSTDSAVSYQIYRDTNSGLTSCGTVSVSTGAQSTWQQAAASGGADPSTCGFVAGDSVLFRINLTAKNNAQAYVSNLNFTFSNN